MPELPEVETVKRGLESLIVGKQFASVDFDWEKSFPNAPADVQHFLIGATITSVRRRAKVLLIELDSAYTLVVHLKMTGQMVYVGKERFGAGHPNESLVGSLPDKSTRVCFYFADESGGKGSSLESSARKPRSAQEGAQGVRRPSTGAADKAIDQERWQSFGLGPKPGKRVESLFFNDQRKFGWVRLLPTIEVPHIDFMKKLGPEPLSDDFTAEVLFERLQRRKRTNIKAALLDQTVLAGIGNIYADEALWMSRIHPKTLVGSLSNAQVENLWQDLRSVLQLSIDKGGSSDKNYVNAEGKKGSYISFAKVFRREGKPCERCGNTIIKTRVAGRGTHTCPTCQPQP